MTPGVDRRRRAIVGGFATAAALGTGLPARADAFPARPVRVIVPFPPGGPADTLMRVIAEKLAAAWRQPVVVDNRTGASGSVAAQAAARSAPDGHTLLMVADPQLVANRFLFKTLAYDPQRDFAPVTALVAFNTGLVVDRDRMPAKTLAELLALLKANPGRYSYGSFGVGSTPHLGMELFKSLAGVDVRHIPYRGLSQLSLDFRAGRVDLAYVSAYGLALLAPEGMARVIATDGVRRSSKLPDVPTFAEAGLPGLEMRTWFGIVVPAATPTAVVQRLHRDVVGVLRDPAVAGPAIVDHGYEVVGNTPAEFARLIDATAAVWGPLIERAKIRLD